MKNPLITIIVPCYNVEKYLDKCVESLVYQTYKNLEIILVNDGSTDCTSQICDLWEKKDNRIKVIHKTNGGLSDARNIAIDLAKGDFFTFVDSDDYVKEDYIEVLYQLVYNKNTLISVTGLQTFYEGYTPKITDNLKSQIVFSTPNALKTMLYQKYFDTQACGKLYHKSLFEDGIRYPKGLLYEDLATTYRLFQKCDKIAFANYKSYYYLLRKNSIEGRPFHPDKFQSCIKIIKQLEIDKQKMPLAIQKAFNCRIVNFAFHILLEIPPKQIIMRKTLFQIIKNKRYGILLDPHARKKTRIACLLSLGGIKCVELFADKGKSRKQ